jgi:hypothetical protein
MIVNLHRWLLQRLAVVWLILSLVSGGLVNYLGHARLDDHMVQMAKAEASAYTAEVGEYFGSPSEKAFTLFKQRSQITIEKDNFVVIRLYGPDKQRIIEVTKSFAQEMENRLLWQNIEFSQNDSIVSEKLELDGATYLRVHLPINNDRGIRTGYFEGIYHAPAEIVSQMKHQSFWSLILVVLAIFLTSLALYPLDRSSQQQTAKLRPHSRSDQRRDAESAGKCHR